MITELDNRYLVFKISDLRSALSAQDINIISTYIDKIDTYRTSINKPINKRYIVVSESMQCVDEVRQLVIAEINAQAE